jgi:hypothetical protein
VEKREEIAGFQLRKKKVIVRKDLGYQNSSFLCQIVPYDEGS